MDRLAGIETWIFDLDHTLYPPSARLFDQINARMTRFIMDRLALDHAQASGLRQRYWQRYGATLNGLVAHHGIEAGDFLTETHAIDYGALRPDPDLGAALAGLPGRRIVHSNGPRAHAEAVLAATELNGLFEAVYGIDDKDLMAKPDPRAYGRIRALAGFEPSRAAMIEDRAENLVEPKRMGMTTIWLCHDIQDRTPSHVDRRITDLTGFLNAQR